jgi:hypothetical protein
VALHRSATRNVKRWVKVDMWRTGSNLRPYMCADLDQYFSCNSAGGRRHWKENLTKNYFTGHSQLGQVLEVTGFVVRTLISNFPVILPGDGRVGRNFA